MFQTYADPCPDLDEIPAPVQKSCFHITKDFIEKNNIPNIKKALNKFIHWLKQFESGPILLLSHAAFRSDMLVLRAEVRAANIPWPNVMFADTLNILRIILPHVGTYNLNSLHVTVTGEDMKFPHSALYDATGLKRIMDHFPYFLRYTTMFQMHEMPFSNLKFIGAKTELYLVQNNFDLGRTDMFEDPPEYLRSLNDMQLASIRKARADGVYTNHQDDETFQCAGAQTTGTVDTT